jgi:hypothetical protein
MPGGTKASTQDVRSSIAPTACHGVMPLSISSWCSWCSLSVDNNHSHAVSEMTGGLATSIPPSLSSHRRSASVQSTAVNSPQLSWTSDSSICVQYNGVQYFDVQENELPNKHDWSATCNVGVFARLIEGIKRNLTLVENTVAQKVSGDTHHNDNLQALKLYLEERSPMSEGRPFRKQMGAWLLRLTVALQGYYASNTKALEGLIRGYNASAQRYGRRRMKAPDEVDPVVLSTLYILDYIVTILTKEEEARSDTGEGATKGKSNQSILSEGSHTSDLNVAPSTGSPISVPEPDFNSIDSSHLVQSSGKVDSRPDAASEVPSVPMRSVDDDVKNAQLAAATISDGVRSYVLKEDVSYVRSFLSQPNHLLSVMLELANKEGCAFTSEQIGDLYYDLCFGPDVRNGRSRKTFFQDDQTYFPPETRRQWLAIWILHLERRERVLKAEKTLQGAKRHQRVGAILNEFQLAQIGEDTRLDQATTPDTAEPSSDESEEE